MAAPSSTALGPLAGRTAIVTGASRGLGREVAAHLASLGANVIINHTSPSSAAAAAEINSSQPSTLRGEIADPAAVRAIFDHAEQTFGGQAHILVNCAGVIDDKYPALAETLDSDWDRTLAVNAKGAFLLGREAANRLVHGGGGRIIMFSSSSVGVHGIEGGCGDDGEDTGQGVEGDEDHGQLRCPGADSDRDVLRREDGGEGEEGGGDLPHGEVGGDGRRLAGGGLRGGYV